MRILATQYTLSMRSLDIYIAGCKAPHCEGCHNPDGWSFEQGNSYGEVFTNKLLDKVKEFDTLVERIMIFGGEPLDSENDQLYSLLSFIKDEIKKPVWLFTRYDLDMVPDNIKERCDYIKCGRYEKDKATEDNEQYGISLATSNQNIYKKGLDF